MKLLCLLVTILSAVFLPVSRADTGTLIPKDKQAPDPTILSLDEMRVEITIDNGDAHVSIVQIFANHTPNIEEGTYRFALPTGSTVSDFAVWDGPVRIPAVILERKQAEQIYAEAKAQAIDPGLLQEGERQGDDPKESSVFTADIVPIPAYGTKRLELEYHQRLETTAFAQFFALPLKPDANQAQTARHFHLHFVLRNTIPIARFEAPGLKLAGNTGNAVEGSFDRDQYAFDNDFKATWSLDAAAADKLQVITYREPQAALPAAGEPLPSATKRPQAPEPGFFEAQLLLADTATPAASASAAPPTTERTLILLFDTSLSMQWEKLERSFAALEATLHALAATDRFNVLLFNSGVSSFKPAPVAADPATVQAALAFVRGSRLRGGTDLMKALNAGLAQAAQSGSQANDNTTLALFTDGQVNEGESVLPEKVLARYAAQWKALPHPPHTAVFAVGDDADVITLRALAHQGGFLESVLSTEPIDFHLKSFLSKLIRDPVSALSLNAPAGTSLVYPLDDAVYPGSIAQWVGQYMPVPGEASFTATALRNGAAVKASAAVALPGTDPAHPQLPRMWAQARVDALLAAIDRDGETKAAIEEIIRLSRRYKFVTPYTSFLAVPRSLLRPRVIRPGDPVLRVRTDPAITSVIALFPFGLTKPLRHLASEDLKAPGDDANRLWETRFLVPTEMKDGTYNVRLILRDTAGNTYNEAKTFVIASTPPTVKLQLSRTSLHRGEALEIRASASQSTRTLTARLDGVNPVALRWNAQARSNTGVLVIPAEMPIGRYALTVTAEDVAHNLGTQEVQVDVLP